MPGLGGGYAPEIDFNFFAGSDINGQTIVMAQNGKIVPFDPSNANNVGLGMTLNGAKIGDYVNVLVEGLVNNTGWGLIPGAVYWAGANGAITPIKPSSGLALSIGIAIDAENLFLKISTSSSSTDFPNVYAITSLRI